MKENNENKAKALEENKKNYSSENSTPQSWKAVLSMKILKDHLKVLLVESSAAMVNDLFQINLKRLV